MKQCYTLTGLDVLGKIRSYIRLLTVILLYVTFALPASAQGGGKAVSGIVKDDTGNPLIGVTVTVPGTTKGTTTDANGTYTINADNSESLNFSYVGYKPFSKRYEAKDFVGNIDVDLAEDERQFQLLWKNYFRALAIPQRINERQQRRMMPRRYWKHLTEME